MPQPARLGLKIKPTARLAPQLHQALSLLQLNQSQLDAHIRECLESNPTLDLDRHRGPAGADFTAWTCQAIRLTDHLLDQAALLAATPRQYRLAEAIIHALDDRGYVADTLIEIASSAELTPPAAVHEVEQVLGWIQQFEPTGIAATSVHDCLTRQLQQQPASRVKDLALRLLNEAHGPLERLDLDAMMDQCQADVAAIQEALRCLQQLDPAPGLGWADERQQQITPDLRFHLIEGKWQVEVHPASQPSLALSPHYVSLVKQVKGKDKRYLQQALQQARELIDGLSLRAQTLHRVASHLANHQSAFLSEGPAALQPLTQVQLAEQLALHPSTVSRAIRDKYALTPRGTIALRQLFSVALPASTESVSAAAAQAMIGRTIAAELPTQPWSDRQLAAHLSQHGLPLSRRTVTKYRQQLGIPGSTQRRRLRRLHPLAPSAINQD
jgi:RNA polymerase sigma-54 factor